MNRIILAALMIACPVLLMAQAIDGLPSDADGTLSSAQQHFLKKRGFYRAANGQIKQIRSTKPLTFKPYISDDDVHTDLDTTQPDKDAVQTWIDKGSTEHVRQ